MARDVGLPTGAIGSSTTRVLLAVMSSPGWPSVSELAERTGLSLGVVHRHLHILREHGLVDFEDHKVRTLHVTAQAVPLP